MRRIEFSYLNKIEKDTYLPELFDLLYDNMRNIAPSSMTYEQEKAEWLSNVSPALDKAPRQIILCCDGTELVGFFQYYIRDDMLMIEEIQIKKEYQRTLLFGKFCKHILNMLPANLHSIEAYADKRNLNSKRIMKKLGMVRLHEDAEFPFVHFRGDVETVRQFFCFNMIDKRTPCQFQNLKAD